MTDSGPKTYMRYVRLFAPAIPYLAVLIGMYTSVSNAWAAILLYHVGIITVLFLARYWKLGRFLKTTEDFLALAGVVLGSAVAGFFIYWLWAIIKLAELNLTDQLSALGLVNAPWFLFIVYYFTVNPLLEEMFWRGYLGSPKLVPTWNDMWFAGYHVLVLISFAGWFWVGLSFTALVITAWFWRQLARRYQGLLLPIASHAAADASIIGAVYFLTRL
jgi:membrane protease YdiL (CAAX protease family)